MTGLKVVNCLLLQHYLENRTLKNQIGMEYKLDRSSFTMQTFQEADRTNVFPVEMPYGQRLQEAYFLSLQAYGYTADDQPKLDRSVFSCRKLDAKLFWPICPLGSGQSLYDFEQFTAASFL